MRTILALAVCSAVQVAFGDLVIGENEDWIPCDNVKNIVEGSALDFSSFWRHSGPAGSKGWVRTVNGHFEFEGEPGRPYRFVGVNLCNEANYPDREQADELIVRLRRIGYNSIRIHHHDRKLFRRDAKGKVAFNEENARRLDYLLARAYAAGMYVTTDLYVSRAVKYRTFGFEGDGKMSGHVYKCLLGVSDAVFADWAAHARLFLERVNTFTGRRYVDEPGLPFLSMVNEGNMLWAWDGVRTLAPMKAEWRDWLRRKRAEHPGFAPGVSEDSEQVAKVGDDPNLFNGRATVDKNAASATMIRFAADLESKAVKREIEFVRSLGSKAILTSLNGGMGYVPMLTTRENSLDWTDIHTYVSHPRHINGWGRMPVGVDNLNWVTEGLKPAGLVFCRTAGKPFAVSEWNFAGPSSSRGMGGLVMGALAAGQDWDALWRFAYSQGGGLEDRSGAPKAFDLATDPLNQATERAVLALFLRGDLAPFKSSVTIDYSEEPDIPRDGQAELVSPKSEKIEFDYVWNTQIAVTAKPRKGGVKFAEVGTSPRLPRKANIGAVRLSREKGTMGVLTERTVGGFFARGGHKVGPLGVDVGEIPATVWATSLDGRAVGNSQRLLLVHLTDVQGSGCVYQDETRDKLIKYGDYPPLARRGTANIRLETDDPDRTVVWALATSGRRIGRVETRPGKGCVAFDADVRGPDGKACFHYEIIRERKSAE